MKNTPSLTFKCGAPEPSVPNLDLPSNHGASSPIQAAVAASPNSMVVLRSSGSTIFEYGPAVISRPFSRPSGFHEALHRVDTVDVAGAAQGILKAATCVGRPSCPGRSRRCGANPLHSTVLGHDDQRLQWIRASAPGCWQHSALTASTHRSEVSGGIPCAARMPSRSCPMMKSSSWRTWHPGRSIYPSAGT